jgi:hypothetical protein
LKKTKIHFFQDQVESLAFVADDFAVRKRRYLLPQGSEDPEPAVK